MINSIQECDVWCFGELYSVLATFADDPAKAIIRIGGGRISIPEDQGNHLVEYHNLLLKKYPGAASLEVMMVVAEIDAILDRNSRGGESYDEWFWSNAGFERHFDWIKIRELARDFLLR